MSQPRVSITDKNVHEDSGSPQRKRPRIDCDSSKNAALSVKLTACSLTSNHDRKLSINETFCDKIDHLKTLLSNSTTVDKDGVDLPNCQVIREPFQVVQLKHFVQDDSVLHSLMGIISTIDLVPKNNDLYRLKQSDDLSNYPQFSFICDFFKNDVRQFLENLTGSSLNSNVALTISKYDENDYLLCHDDQLDNRKIAFILYLVEQSWSAEDGGQLELFDCDSVDHQPLQIVKRLIPEWNLFNFFIVQPFTYHQVSEVKTCKSPRWSINGWFHSNSVTVVPRNYSFPLISKIRHPILLQAENSIDYDVLLSWINPRYTVDEMQEEIQDSFVENSEIALPNFLRVEKYNQLADSLANIDILNLWKRNFRPVLANYDYIPDELVCPLEGEKTNQTEKTDIPAVPNIVREAFRLFYSEAFFLVISNLTGIRLHKMAVINEDEEEDKEENGDDLESNKPNCASMCRGEIRRWQVGDFTLASSIAPEYFEDKALDFMLFFNVSSKNESTMISNEKTNNSNYKESKAGSSKETVSSNCSKVCDIEMIDDEDDEVEDEEDDDDVDNLIDSDSNHTIDLSNSDSDSEDEKLDPERERAGGYISYIDESTTDDLLTIEPTNNCLNLVYRMRGTQRFMKYLTSHNTSTPFNEISIVYYQEDILSK